MNIVVGAGEVGSAVAAVLSRAHDVVLRDVEPLDATGTVLHVCFPWSDRFEWYVHRYQQEHAADVVVVYSTVPVGVCDTNGWVHSPVTGKHPHLEESLLTFARVTAGANAEYVAQLWRQVSPELEVIVLPRAAESEAAKIWDLIQYGLQIQTEKAIHAWCDAQGLDFNHVYTQSAQIYNKGYTELKMAQYVRPILQHIPGPIGGHCVVQNSGLIDHPLAQLVERPHDS